MTIPIRAIPGADFLALQEILAGRYSIERELGRGGMGVVLLARDVALDRLVAIKLLPPALATSPDHRERFLREARTAAGLSHPNIVPIHTVEAHGDIVFFVMGFVDGETLRARVERAGPLSPRLAMKFLQDVAWALAYAHQRGVIHRDIKPDNIMIETATDRALVTDFGIAIGGRHDDGTAEIAGTARYMSPEQALGEPVDGRSDLYSLGATFFFALTGRPPYEGASLPAILARQVSDPVPAVQSLRPEVPARFATLIEHCLQRDPADRFASADDVARAADEARGRDFRAPPLVRSFLRNAQVTTMVMLAVGFAGEGIRISDGNMSIGGGPGIIAIILVVQLVAVARRLLREGYAFADIRQALLAEAQVQQEEADVIQQGRWSRRLNTIWHRLWAGRFGRWFFAVAGWRLKTTARRAVPSADATELVLGRSALAAYQALPDATRFNLRAVPAAVDRLETQAEALRERGQTGEPLVQTMAALENIRLALLRLQAGSGSVQDLSLWLERARDIGDRVGRELEAREEVRAALGRG
ncbi:MAG: serine/threonine protein kinase [Gemmatimonadetes bacterium]|nr:serine/threonine protein kinase [Gemmatimonadota bacterium]